MGDEHDEGRLGAGAADGEVLAGEGRPHEGGGGLADGGVVTASGVRIAGRSHLGLLAGSPACIAVRPQKIRLIDASTAAPTEGTAIPFELKTVLYQGANYEILGTTPLGDMRILTERAPPTGEVRVLLPAEECLCVRP